MDPLPADGMSPSPANSGRQQPSPSPSPQPGTSQQALMTRNFSPPRRFSPVPPPTSGVKGPFAPRGAHGGRRTMSPWGWDYHDLKRPFSAPYVDDQKDRTFLPEQVGDPSDSSDSSVSHTSRSRTNQGGGQTFSAEEAAADDEQQTTSAAAAAAAAEEFDPLRPRSPTESKRPKRKAAETAEKKFEKWGEILGRGEEEEEEGEDWEITPANTPSQGLTAGNTDATVEAAARQLEQQQQQTEEEETEEERERRLQREAEEEFEQQMHSRSNLTRRTP